MPRGRARTLAAVVVSAAVWLELGSPARAAWVLDEGVSRADVVLARLADAGARLGSAACEARAERLAREGALAFFESSAPLFFHDLHTQGILSASPFAAPKTWIAGNLHPRAIRTLPGGVADSAVLDVAALDEAWPGSYLIDVYRFATALELLARHNRHALYAAELTAAAAYAAVTTFASQYASRLAFHNINAPRAREFALSEATGASGRLRSLLEDVESEALATARAAMLSQLACSWTAGGGGRGLRTVATAAAQSARCDPANPQLADVDEATRAAVVDAVAAYHASTSSCAACASAPGGASAFAVLDVAESTAEGPAAFVALLRGPTDADADDVLLQLRLQARPPAAVLASAAETSAVDAAIATEGERAALARRAMLAHPDPFTGHAQLPASVCEARLPAAAAAAGCAFVVHELSPYERVRGRSTRALGRPRHTLARALVCPTRPAARAARLGLGC